MIPVFKPSKTSVALVYPMYPPLQFNVTDLHAHKPIHCNKHVTWIQCSTIYLWRKVHFHDSLMFPCR